MSKITNVGEAIEFLFRNDADVSRLSGLSDAEVLEVANRLADSKLPKIPTVFIVVTKQDEQEEFASYKEFEDWAINECDKELRHMWRFTLCSDGRRGYEDMRDWVRNGLSMEDLGTLVLEKGWSIRRIEI